MKLFVPILVNEEIGKERDKKLFSVKSEKHNFMNINGFQKPRELLKRLESYFHPYFFSIGLHDDKRKPFVQFDSCSENLNSISLGVFCSAYATAKNLKFKEKYDSITITGNFEIVENEIHLLDVVEIEQKFEAVQKYVSEHKDFRHLFVYVAEKEEVLEGIHENNLLVVRIQPGKDINLLFAEIFEPKFSDEQNKSVRDLYIKRSNEFVQTKSFLEWKKEIVRQDCGGFVITGESNTGKSIVANALCEFMMETKTVDDVVWISVIDNSKFWDLIKSDAISKLKNPSMPSESEIRKYFKSEFDKLDRLLYKNKKVALVFDNLEHRMVDDILYFCKRNSFSRDKNIKLIMTSWEKCRSKELLHSLFIYEKGMHGSELGKNEFDEIAGTIITKLGYMHKFKSEGEKQKFLIFLKDECKNFTGYIPLVVNSLKYHSVEETIQLYPGYDVNESFAKHKIWKICIEQIDFISLLVLFAFIQNFFQFDVNKIIKLIHKKIFNSQFKKTIVTKIMIRNAMQELLNVGFIQRTDGGEYTMKRDAIKYCIFSDVDKGEIIKEIAEIREAICEQSIKPFIAMDFNLFDEFKKIKEYEKQQFGNDKEIASLYLTRACRSNCNLNFLEYLLEYGADVNWYNDSNDTYPLGCIAEYTDSVEKIDFLIKKGADPFFVPKDGRTILIYASSNPNSDILKYVLENHFYSDINHESDFLTALTSAVYSGNIENIEILLNHGARYSTTFNNSILQRAVWIKNTSILSYILKNKLYVDINERNEKGFTPLVVGLLNLSFEQCRMLINFGANAQIDKECLIRVSQHKSDALGFILDNNLCSNLDMPVDDVDGGETALMAAACVGNVESCKLLIKHGADWKCRDVYGDTCFSQAGVAPNAKTLRYLYKHGYYSKENSSDMDKSEARLARFGLQTNHYYYAKENYTDIDKALLAASWYGVAKSCEFLLSVGANPHIKDMGENTILHQAVLNENKKVLPFLLSKKDELGLDVFAKNKKGLTPLDIAKQNNKAYAERILSKYL